MLVSVNGEAVHEATRASELLQQASQLRLHVVTPMGLEEMGSDGFGLTEVRRRHASSSARRVEELLETLRLETAPPADDPLSEATREELEVLPGGEDASMASSAQVGGLCGGGDDGSGSGNTDGADNADGDNDDDGCANDATAHVSGDDVLPWKFRRHCLLGSNAWMARRQLQTLASHLEANLASSAEQYEIASQSFVDAFAALRRAIDEQLAVLGERLLSPMAAHISTLGMPVSSPFSASRPESSSIAAGESAGQPVAGLGTLSSLALGRLLGSYSHAFTRLHQWLAPEAVQRLLQRLWTEFLAALTRALYQHLYSPRALGDAFVANASEMLHAVACLIRDAHSGPPLGWLRRRATPLHATFALTSLPTAALLQQFRIQPIGPRRAAPLVALALRFDDREAAEGLMGGQPAELGDVDEATGLAVDGLAALEAYRKLEPLGVTGQPVITTNSD